MRDAPLAPPEFDPLETLRARPRADYVAIVLAALAAVLAYGLSVELFPYHSLNHDEAVYLQQAAMLLEGRLFLRPPVPVAFRPWFFVRAAGPSTALYPKYAPVPAAMFALGELAGRYRFALAAVAAGNVALTYAVVTAAFDRRRGVLAAAFLLASPLFLLQSAVFLPYAPTTLWNLAFAFSYLRAHRTGSGRWAVLAGGAIGVAFFSRPYTAVVFAAPFLAHAAWTLRGDPVDRDALVRHLVTAAVGLAGVAVALGYNAVATGDPLTFPYAAFAPEDGLGFGHHEILGYERVYTPELALRANARLVRTFFAEWIAGGALGGLLALAGLGLVAVGRFADGRFSPDRVSPGPASPDRDGAGRTVSGGSRAGRAVLAGLFVAIPLGNVYFWGNLNVLGELAAPGDGLVAFLGPYYHFDLLVPTAAFAAHAAATGATLTSRSVRERVGSPARARAALAVLLLVSAAAFAVPTAVAIRDPIERNAAVTAAYEEAYRPFERRDLEDALVFLPTPYGDWMNHPFQALRNEPGFDGETVYALRENQFAVVDAFPDRRLYRYTYHGQWVPAVGRSVEPRLQPVRAVGGERVRLALGFDVPDGVESVTLRLASERGRAYYVANGTSGSLDVTLVVAPNPGDTGGLARIEGPVTPVDDPRVATDDRDELRLVALLDYGNGAAVSYRVELPTATADGTVRALTPYLELCRIPSRCGGEAAYLPAETRPGLGIDHDLSAANASKRETARAPTLPPVRAVDSPMGVCPSGSNRRA